MVILGGSGSQPGVVLGAVLVGILLELLRDPGDSRILFYSAIFVGVVAVWLAVHCNHARELAPSTRAALARLLLATAAPLCSA